MFKVHPIKLAAGMVALFALSAALFISVTSMKPAQANNQRAITIHDRGETYTVTTNAKNIGEVLQRANVAVGQADMIEPAAETELTAPAYTVNVYRARPVTIIDGAERKQVMSPYQSPRSIVAHADMDLHAEDVTEMARIDDFLNENGPGVKVTIDRAVLVNLVLYGTPTQIRTQATTVGELLQEKGIKLGPDDGISLAKETPITENMILDVWRNGVQTKTEEQPVPFETETIQNADKEVGFKEIRKAGKNGKKMVTYQIELKNGQEVSRKEIQNVVTEQAEKQEVVVGTKAAGFSGDFGAALAQLRSCEAGGRYDRNSGNGYYGAYQYNLSTWANYGGYQYPHEAPPAVQDQKVWETYQRRGWQPWPSCSQKLGLQDIYR